MTVEVDEARLDDVAALEAADPQHMLRAVASSAAQVRRSLTAARESGLEQIAQTGRPRAVIVTGMGGSGIAGEVLAAVSGPTSPVPVVVHRGYGLPPWVGAADLVIAVSCSGTTQETLSAFDEAARRGAVLAAVGAAGSPLARRCEQARAAFVAVEPVLSPRSSLWALTTPVLLAGARLGLHDLGPGEEALEHAATRLEQVAQACRPDRDSFVNPAKILALELAGSLPMIWGAGALGGVAATRMACQLAENAKYPAVSGVLPEAHHNQVVAFDGPFAGAGAGEDLFRDRLEDAVPLRLRVVLLHDAGGASGADARVAASEQVASARGVPVSLLRSEGSSPVERLASLVGVVDYTSVYLALLYGIDPTPIEAINDLKAQLR